MSLKRIVELHPHTGGGCLEWQRAIITVLQEFKFHQQFPNSPPRAT